MRLSLALAVCGPAAFLSYGCALYQVQTGTSSPTGIPFYIKKAGCIQETVRLETVYRLTLKQLAPASSGDKATSLTVREALFWKKDLQQASTDLTALRNAMMNTATSAGDVVAAFDKLLPKSKTDTMTAEQALEAPVVSNHAAVKAFVDYSKPHYVNVKRPWIGSVNATTEVGADGTLSKAQAEVEDKTVETVLSLLPIKEVLQKRAGISPNDSTLHVMVAGTAPTLQFTLEEVAIKHTWTKPLAGPNSLPDCATGPALASNGDGVSYQRELVGKDSGEKSPDDNSIAVTGKIVLPKAKGDDEKKP